MRISQRILLVFTAIMAVATTRAQVKLPLTNNDLRTNLEKIIADFPHQLSSVLGDTLIENPQTIEFATLLDFQGAQENSIIQYKSGKPIYSWKALLLETEEYEDAVKKYNWLYNQLKVMTVKLEGGYSFTLSGDYNEPDESKKFSSSIFMLTPNAVNLPKLRIEAALQYEFPEWKVNLLVYEKEREDNEQGEINEN